MREIKLLAIDIDETLIRPSADDISRGNRAAVRAAREAGVIVTLATGRIYAAARAWVERLHITAPVIACNGADIRVDHKPVYRCNLDDALVAELLEPAGRYGVRRYIFSGDCAYCTPADRDEALFKKWFDRRGGTDPVVIKPDFGDILSCVRGDVQKLLLWADRRERHERVLAALRPYAERCNIVTGEALNVEINDSRVSKSAALERVARQYGIGMEQTMAIGDSGNDAAMLRAAGVGVAVENAMPAAREAAAHMTASCDRDGVAGAIERFILRARTI
jgi:Cof subfamily protein (haloacid dehalogenase superfamily)